MFVLMMYLTLDSLGYWFTEGELGRESKGRKRKESEGIDRERRDGRREGDTCLHSRSHCPSHTQ